MKNFINICKMDQAALKKYVAKHLSTTYPDVQSGNGYVYAQGTMPVLLVAHLDTVHKNLPQTVWYDEETKAISSPEGIGGDDRAGVYILLEIIKKFPCSVLFCEDEEIGAVGADKFTDTDFARQLSFNYIIEFDRKGSNDAVFYDCDNPKFDEFITKDFFKTSIGSFTDISILAPFFGCAAVNLSCGYYNAHTTSEYVIFPEMLNVIEEACKILERTTEKDAFEYIPCEKQSTWDYWDFASSGSRKTSESYYIIEYEDETGETQWYDTSAISMEEAIGKFCINTLLPYTNITNISEEDY
ncbi:MAG: hypothetical protein ACI4E1_12295 [Lachnospira sp.]